jgi:hypothetical protein
MRLQIALPASDTPQRGSAKMVAADEVDR